MAIRSFRSAEVWLGASPLSAIGAVSAVSHQSLPHLALFAHADEQVDQGDWIQGIDKSLRDKAGAISQIVVLAGLSNPRNSPVRRKVLGQRG